jgi:hypothetical protein
MAFDVSKFLALTVLIAGTGAACSSTDKKDEPAGGAGTSGSAGQSSAGKSNNQAGAADAGNGGAAAGSAGEGGGPAAGGGGAGAGGESLGGGGAGGATDTGECLGALALGGAGGAGGAGVEPSLEGLCMDFFDVVCAASPEDYPPSYTVCEGVKERAQPAVAVAVRDCIKALSADDACDGAKVAACFTKLEGKGCANPDGAAACTAIQAREGCDTINPASCEKIADLVSPDMFDAFTECMDPSIEGYFDTSFTGTCGERLDSCAGVSL